MGLAQVAWQRILAGISRTKKSAIWEAAEKQLRIDEGWNASHMIGQFGEARVNFKFKCNVFKATVQVALLTGLCAFAGQNGSFTIVPIEMKHRIQRLGWGKKTAERNQNDDLCHRQVLAAVFGQTRLEKFPWMTEDEKLTPCATPWAKQFHDYINSLKEFEGSNDFARERRWRPRRLTSFKRSSSTA